MRDIKGSEGMKFVHIADTHFDSPFVNLSDREGFGDLRRLDQRRVFRKIVDYVKDSQIPYLFISGDLYENKFVKKSTIQYVNNLFEEIANTKIFITPGNHDPFLKNSYYSQYRWSDNVKIFGSKMEKVSFDEVDIYGFGFDNFYCDGCGVENLCIENPNKINILVVHGTLNGAVLKDNNYNPISEKVLEDKGFDYVALGHIHKLYYNDIPNQKIVYPGSTVSMGFDELGEHGMIVGDVHKEKNNSNVNLQFISLDDKRFVEREIDVTNILSIEELIEKINKEDFNQNEFVKIILIGKRNFEINPNSLYKVIQNDKVIKIKNKTKINYSLEQLSNENTLKGLFAKKINEKMKLENLSEEEKDIIEKAVEITFDALK